MIVIKPLIKHGLVIQFIWFRFERDEKTGEIHDGFRIINLLFEFIRFDTRETELN